MRLVLKSERFKLIWLGTSKLHLLDTTHPYGPASGGYTMCGKPYSETDVTGNASIKREHVCGSCLRTLYTYHYQQHVTFEE